MTERVARATRVLHLEPTGTAAQEVRDELRRLVAGTVFAARVDDALLAATELVSNAVLHGREPIVVTLSLDEDHLKVSVRDRSAVSPSFSLLDPTAVTGRGLLLVSSLSDGWGVEPEERGKTVWMQLRAVPATKAETADLQALLDAWGDELVGDPAREEVRVVLTDVDVALVARGEAAVEGVLRELALVAGGDAASPRQQQAARSILRALGRFDAVRASVKRQLAAAVAAGTAKADITLTIVRADAELVRDYAYALDQVDRLGASGELLVHPPEPAVVEARRSLLHRILAQLSS